MMLATRFALGLFAFAGGAGAHTLAYFVSAPDGHHRAELLAATGHGYWPLVAPAAIGALAAALGVLLLGRVGRREAPSLIRAFVRLALLQTVGYFSIEVGERLVSGAGLESLWHEPTLALGLVFQVVAAFVGAWLFRATRDLGDRLTGGDFGGAPIQVPVEILAAKASVFITSTACRRPIVRGPPLLSF